MVFPLTRKIPVDPDCVRAKTFSTHIASKIHPVVRKSGVFTHESILLGQSHQNITPPTMGFRRSMVIWYQINV